MSEEKATATNTAVKEKSKLAEAVKNILAIDFRARKTSKEVQEKVTKRIDAIISRYK